MTDDSSNNEHTPESLLPDLKTELGAECKGISDEYLLIFLYWKPSVDRAADRFRDFVAWKTDNENVFGETLRISTDPELERLLLSEVMVSPPNLTTTTGGPVFIGRFRNNDMTDGRTIDGVCRMAFYTIDRVLQRPETQKHGITVIHDLRGFNRGKNARIEVAKRMLKGIHGVFPVNVKDVYIVDAPLVFIGFFKLISLFSPKKMRDRIHFIGDFDEIDVVDAKNLLPEMGGTLEWSARDWVDEQKREEESGNWKSLTNVGVVSCETNGRSSAGDVNVETKGSVIGQSEC